jgi:hypothetical protein
VSYVLRTEFEDGRVKVVKVPWRWLANLMYWLQKDTMRMTLRKGEKLVENVPGPR